MSEKKETDLAGVVLRLKRERRKLRAALRRLLVWGSSTPYDSGGAEFHRWEGIDAFKQGREAMRRDKQS
jgi:hypothetical protein